MTPYLIALAFARALDASSTCVALAHGAHEANPLMPSTCRGQIVAQSAITLGESVLLVKLAHTQPKLAKGLALVSVGIESSAAVLNFKLTWGSK
jgi:hypothetical protein